jgi:predicted enzyme related to lactoylglutathione lyase
MPARVVHFEIQADDLDRAKAFYQAALGWRFDDYSQAIGSPYFGVITGADDEPGINGGLLPRPAAAPGPGHGTNSYVCTVQVTDYDEVEKKVLDAGGQVAMPKTAMLGVAWQGYYLDTEGNTFGIHQPDPNAA